MRTGKIIIADGSQPHLAAGSQWVEIWPDGSYGDWRLLTRTPARDLSYSQTPVGWGCQSPILVRAESELMQKLASQIKHDNDRAGN